MKNKTTAILLCFFLGALGVHAFYLGKGLKGVIYLFTLGIFGIGALVDFVVLLFMSENDFNLKYNQTFGGNTAVNQTLQNNINIGQSETDLDKLKKMADLNKDGIISDEELAEYKRKLTQ